MTLIINTVPVIFYGLTESYEVFISLLGANTLSRENFSNVLTKVNRDHHSDGQKSNSGCIFALCTEEHQ